jgi:YggT family protein
MLINLLVQFINTVANFIILLVVISAILSFFMSPYHPVRQALDRLIEPMLAPIRRVVPLVGMFDFSPLILIVLIQLLSFVLIRLLYLLR